MANSAFAFYLFGYQVHEKSVLLPALPVTLLAASEPELAAALPILAVFSMWPLLKKDGLGLAYVAVAAFFVSISKQTSAATVTTFGRTSVEAKSARQATTAFLQHLVMDCGTGISLVGALLIHAATMAFPAPARYPYLHDAAFTTYAFAHFILIWGYLNWRQWHQCNPAQQDAKVE